MKADIWLRRARELDQADDWSALRDEFYLPPDTIYLDGNSLGLLSRRAEASLFAALDAWRRRGIGGWLEADPPWYTLAETLAARMAPLVGAAPDELIVANSTTVNLHQLLATLYHPRPERGVILMDEISFPSNHHAVASQLSLRGLDRERHLRIVRARDDGLLAEDDLIAALRPDVALLLLPAVIYTTGQLLDLPRLASSARDAGALIGLDCSHSVGAVPHRFDEWGVDFAYWCTYKYLNGGPGSPAALYLNRRHADRRPGLAGWFGGRKETMFQMRSEFDAAPGAFGLQIGSPTILGMAPLAGSLEMLTEVGIERLRGRSLSLTAFLMEALEEQIGPLGVSIANPRAPERRGGHVALRHEEADVLCRALRTAGVVPDYRPPRIIRLAPAAAYCTFEDCAVAVERLAGILRSGAHRRLSGDPEMIS